jgi:hypothetical protein
MNKKLKARLAKADVSRTAEIKLANVERARNKKAYQ